MIMYNRILIDNSTNIGADGVIPYKYTIIILLLTLILTLVPFKVSLR